jgi:hypothetical protein
LVYRQRQHPEHQMGHRLGGASHPRVPRSKLVLQPCVDPLPEGAEEAEARQQAGRAVRLQRACAGLGIGSF